MKKNLLLASFLLSIFANTTYGKAPTFKSRFNKNTVQKIKFGPQIGLGILSDKAGITGEYGINDTLAVQIGLTYFFNGHFLTSTDVSNGGSALVRADYISLPILLRAYVKENKKSCWFGGIQLSYLIEAEFKFIPDRGLTLEDFNERTQEFKKAEVTKLKEIDEQDKINKLQFGFVAGFDYEFDFGLTLGITFTKDLRTIIKSDTSYLNWALQPTLGFNLGKFL
jgi:hypothetical protein